MGVSDVWRAPYESAEGRRLVAVPSRHDPLVANFGEKAVLGNRMLVGVWSQGFRWGLGRSVLVGSVSVSVARFNARQ